MPHVKFSGNVDLKSSWERPPAFRIAVPELDCHIKFSEAFLGSSGTACLFRFVVAEGRLTQHIQVLLAKDPDGWLLKLDRTYPVLRSPGVKLLLGMLARWLEVRGASVSKSNIGDALVRGAFYADHPPSPQATRNGTEPSPVDALLDGGCE